MRGRYSSADLFTGEFDGTWISRVGVFWLKKSSEGINRGKLVDEKIEKFPRGVFPGCLGSGSRSTAGQVRIGDFQGLSGIRWQCVGYVSKFTGPPGSTDMCSISQPSYGICGGYLGSIGERIG